MVLRSRGPDKSSWRGRYFAAASILFVILGVVILVRSIVGHVFPIAILGLVFIGLGLVRLRDYVFTPGGK